MSDPMTIVYVAGLVLGAKTALEGLQEGNLTKAIVGGVSAYFGASGLMGGTAALGGSAVVGETVGASSGMTAGVGIEMGGTAMTGVGDLVSPSFVASAAPATTSSSLAASQAINAGTTLMDAASINGLASSTFSNGVMPASQNQTSLLDPSSGSKSIDLVGDDMSVAPDTMTTKAPNMKMDDSNIFSQGKETLTDAWDSAKEMGTELGTFAKDNPFMAQQMVGSGVQLLAGNQANDTAEELAEKKEAWEREQILAKNTFANIYIDAQGVARDQYGKALDQQA